MFDGNCALRFNEAEEKLAKESEIKLHVVNNWLEANVKRMKRLTVVEPTDWAEGGGTCWGV